MGTLQTLPTDWITCCGWVHGTAETIWDGLARKNPVHAAVSAPTEQQEKAKSREQIRILRENLNDGVVLDLGCGYGRIAKYLLAGPDRFQGYIGLDCSEEMLQLFFNRHQKSSVERKTPLILIKSHICWIARSLTRCRKPRS